MNRIIYSILVLLTSVVMFGILLRLQSDNTKAISRMELGIGGAPPVQYIVTEAAAPTSCSEEKLHILSF